ncbi:hypothetical protein Q9252_16340 [Marinobacter salarius]|uniref:hypothetical protein n=1 Tax=Marinobacter salarius TaxID=1420917 RepID=UPI00273C2DD4|nr:hypothetical protein [Marinobacter salarius]MDP4533714.1 hypothetical protein [Marinobacter salarius]
MEDIDGIYFAEKPGEADSLEEAIEPLISWGRESEVLPVIGESATGSPRAFVSGWLRVSSHASLKNISDFDILKEALAHMKTQLKPTEEF